LNYEGDEEWADAETCDQRSDGRRRAPYVVFGLFKHVTYGGTGPGLADRGGASSSTLGPVGWAYV